LREVLIYRVSRYFVKFFRQGKNTIFNLETFGLYDYHCSMKIYTALSEITEPITNPFVTIGNFDGVHLGHQMLFSEVMSRAYRNHGTSVAVTFNPHPLKVVRPDIGIKLISNCDQKRELIEHAGLDVLIIIPFTREFAATSAVDFVDKVLIGTIGLKELVVGYDYAFGKGRQGDINFLKKQGELKNFPVTVVEPYYVNGVIASSTKVRELVSAGRMEEVPRDRRVTIFCGSGLRSMIAASLLKREGWHDLAVVLGGIAGWRSVSCPIRREHRPG